MSEPKTQNQNTFPITATLISFVAIVIMLVLGFWQLDRKQQKEERLQQIEYAEQQSSLGLSDVTQSYLNYQDYLIEVSGELLPNSFYIDNKLHDGKAGYNVLQPFKTDSGIVILDLGWLASTAPRPSLPSYTPPTYRQVRGILNIPSDNQMIKETNVNIGAFPAVLQQIDLQQVERHLASPVLPFVLRLQNEDDSPFVREWQAVTMSPEKHLGYAIQWFGLAVAGLTVYLLSLLKWMQNPNSKNKEWKK